jgi:hypothetical protein
MNNLSDLNPYRLRLVHYYPYSLPISHCIFFFFIFFNFFRQVSSQRFFFSYSLIYIFVILSKLLKVNSFIFTHALITPITLQKKIFITKITIKIVKNIQRIFKKYSKNNFDFEIVFITFKPFLFTLPSTFVSR